MIWINKKLIVLALAVAMLSLPMISVAQAKPGGIPTATYHDLNIFGIIFPDGPAEDVVVRENTQYGRYTAQSWGTNDGVNWFPAVVITWNGIFMVDPDTQVLLGTATYDVDYKINTDTMKGVVHLAAEMVFLDGTFEGDIFFTGELLLLPDNTVNIALGENSMWHSFFKGTGAYEGWTIVQNMNANPPWFEFSIYGSTVAGDSHLTKPIDE